MTVDTPDPTDIPGQGDTIASRNGQNVEPSDRRVRWLSVFAVVAVLTLAGGIALFLFMAHGTAPGTDKRERAAPTRGLACPALQQASDAYAQGDLETYNEAIDNALRIAQDTLQISGQAFGEPERIALELGLREHADVSRFLTQASTACSRLGKWSAPGS